MATRLTPYWVNQACKVELVNAKGSPEENPKNSTVKIRGLKLSRDKKENKFRAQNRWGMVSFIKLFL